jgi:hypothetical protein
MYVTLGVGAGGGGGGKGADACTPCHTVLEEVTSVSVRLHLYVVALFLCMGGRECVGG